MIEAKENRVVKTAHLCCQNGDVSWWNPALGCWRFIGHVDAMPEWLSIELMIEWGEIYDLLFEEFIKALEAGDAGFESEKE